MIHHHPPRTRRPALVLTYTIITIALHSVADVTGLYTNRKLHQKILYVRRSEFDFMAGQSITRSLRLYVISGQNGQGCGFVV